MILYSPSLQSLPASLSRHPALLSRHPTLLNRRPALLNRHPALLNRHPALLNRHPTYSTDILPYSTDILPYSTDILLYSADILPYSTDILPSSSIEQTKPSLGLKSIYADMTWLRFDPDPNQSQPRANLIKLLEHYDCCQKEGSLTILKNIYSAKTRWFKQWR